MRVSDEELQRLLDYKAAGEIRDCLLDLQDARAELTELRAVIKDLNQELKGL